MTIDTEPSVWEDDEDERARRPVAPPTGPGGRMGAFGLPLERAQDARGTFRRLIERLSQEWLRIVAVVVLSIGAVALTVMGPKMLGHATDILVKGLTHGGAGAID